MPNLHINYTPEFSKYVVDEELLPPESFIVFDCGARGGLEKYWDVLGYTLQAVAFEPDSKKCKKLNKINKNRNIKFYPYFLSDKSSKKSFYHAKYPYASSFFAPNKVYIGQLCIDDALEITKVEMIQTICLKEFCEENSFKHIDFIKLDTEGSELEILVGLGDLINELSGVLSEFRFQKKLNNSPTFVDLYQFLDTKGFEIYDMDTYRLSRKVLPLPYLYDFRDDQGKLVPGPSAFGQIMHGDALFLKELKEQDFSLEKESKK